MSERPLMQPVPRDAGMGPLPYLTAESAGIGGRLKLRAEDFEVEEIPAYEPCGQGEHLFLWIEKRDVAADALTSYLARCLEIPRSDVGMAGLKDRRAVTRQFVSVPARAAPLLTRVGTEAIRLLDQRLHRNKLRTGHLKGNRFSILVRDVAADAGSRAGAIRRRLSETGFPNYFGEQRFGNEGETLTTGFSLLRRDGRLPTRKKFLVRLGLSAVQSYLFNLALAERIADGLVERVLAGDVMQVCASGGPFVVDDPDREQQRFNQGETMISGPLFGPKMTRPAGEAARREERLLERCGLKSDDFARHRKLAPGTRRPYLSRPESLSIGEEPEGLRFRFSLPKGVYATTLLREFMKVDDDPVPVQDLD